MALTGRWEGLGVGEAGGEVAMADGQYIEFEKLIITQNTQYN